RVVLYLRGSSGRMVKRGVRLADGSTYVPGGRWLSRSAQWMRMFLRTGSAIRLALEACFGPGAQRSRWKSRTAVSAGSGSAARVAPRGAGMKKSHTTLRAESASKVKGWEGCPRGQEGRFCLKSCLTLGIWIAAPGSLPGRFVGVCRTKWRSTAAETVVARNL